MVNTSVSAPPPMEVPAQTSMEVPTQSPMQKPNLTDQEFETMRKRLCDFDNKYGEEINILIIGGTGCGKSSLINSCLRIISGKIKQIVEARPSQTAVTRKLSIISIPDLLEEGHFRLWDTWGWNGNNYGSDTIVRLLKGELLNGFVSGDNPLGSSNVRTGPVSRNQQVHGVIFVVPTEQASSEEYYASMKPWLQACQDRMIDSFVVVTKVDKIDPLLISQPDALWDSQIVNQLRHQVAQNAGIDAQHVYPLVNYKSQTRNIVAIDINLATIFLRALDVAETSLQRWFNDFAVLPSTSLAVVKLKDLGVRNISLAKIKRAIYRANGDIDLAFWHLKSL